MSTWAVSMVKDEADVIAGTLTHLADEVDGIIVADNGSTDDTRKILDALELDCELVIVDDPDPAYYQSEKMTRLASMAHDLGAEWIVPFDADEVWYGADRINIVLAGLPGAVTVAEAHLLNHFPSAIDPEGDDPFRTIIWRQRNPAGLPKVAFRWQHDAVVHQGNHGVTMARHRPVSGVLGVRHFPYRSVEQFVRKAVNGAAAYAATDLPAEVGAHWRGYGELVERHGEDVLGDVFREHFWFLAPFEHDLTPDPAPYMRWRT